MLADAHRRVLRYTSGQRRADTMAAVTQHTLHKERHRRATVGGGARAPQSASAIERRMVETGVSKRSCHAAGLMAYVAFRERERASLQATYRRRSFRAMRLLAWSRRDQSVRQFAQRILEVFGSRDPQASVRVIILYGDWGRNPNLKHQAPTPGIGLRRLLDNTPGILTVTVRETYTSSYCPCCGHDVCSARGQHGLLKCQPGGCGKYWARDVVGALNILSKGIHLLTHGTPHGLFGP
jgi:hypothetical protein